MSCQGLSTSITMHRCTQTIVVLVDKLRVLLRDFERKSNYLNDFIVHAQRGEELKDKVCLGVHRLHWAIRKA